MGEVLPEHVFLNKYAHRYRALPKQYYSNHTMTFERQPALSELAHFLETGQIPKEPPWRRVVYTFPQEKKEEVYAKIAALSMGFDYNIKRRVNRARRIIGSMVELLGMRLDVDGEERAVIHAVLDTEGEVQKVNCIRRRLVSRAIQSDEFHDDLLRQQILRLYYEQNP